MEAKDTVMSPIDISKKVREIVTLSPIIGEAGVNIKIAELQAEISFKAGFDSAFKMYKGKIDAGWPERREADAKQEGRREVVECFDYDIAKMAEQFPTAKQLTDFINKWQSKLEEWLDK